MFTGSVRTELPPESRGGQRRAEQPRQIEAALTQIEAMLSTIKYGSIEISIQDGYVVQIEKTEKIRLK